MARSPLVVVVLALGCFAATDAAAQSYPVRGMVMRVDAAARTVVVSHDAVPGLMAAMTMPFEVKDARELNSLVPGALVEFTLVVTKDTSYATAIKVRPYQSAELDPMNAQRLAVMRRLTRGGAMAPVVKVGQPMPDFTLTNQANQRVSLSAQRGKVVALTFVYTSCALPNFCLRSANNLGAVQRRFSDRMGKDLILLTVTFDPLRDTPAVLAKYASQWKADPRTWHFLTGPVADVKHVTEMFGIDAFPNEGLMDHSLRTAIIDRRGTVVASIEGNRFTATQLGDLVQTALSSK